MLCSNDLLCSKYIAGGHLQNFVFNSQSLSQFLWLRTTLGNFCSTVTLSSLCKINNLERRLKVLSSTFIYIDSDFPPDALVIFGYKSFW